MKNKKKERSKQDKQRNCNPGFRRIYFSLAEDLSGRIPSETALEGKEAQESWLILLRAQERKHTELEAETGCLEGIWDQEYGESGKTRLDLKLAKDVKGNKKGFCKYVHSKTKAVWAHCVSRTWWKTVGKRLRCSVCPSFHCWGLSPCLPGPSQQFAE